MLTEFRCDNPNIRATSSESIKSSTFTCWVILLSLQTSTGRPRTTSLRITTIDPHAPACANTRGVAGTYERGTNMVRIRPPQSTTPIAAEFAAIQADLLSSVALSESSKLKYSEALLRLQLYLERGHLLSSITEAEDLHIRDFVESKIGKSKISPSAATMHFRRSAARLAWRHAREVGITIVDPTRYLELPARTTRFTRPLTATEITRCRAASVHTLNESRLPAAWALAEATATSSELAALSVRDLDLEASRVWIAGSSRTVPRWGQLDAWGLVVVKRRMEALGYDPDSRLVYSGQAEGASAGSSASQALRWTLIRAGLGSDPSVRPSSIRVSVGRHLADEGVPVEDIARRLGIRSLDRTAQLIGHHR